jgi:2-polyprenyl-3-methyl-5-hydroxy-6-metoxy-1,4-benzoquinol methylase
MNRKQRRALRSRGAEPPFRSTANIASAESLDTRAETHRMLGAALMAQSKASEAIHHFEHVIALKPNLPSAYEDLARACFAAGHLKLAIGAASRALAIHETAQTKILFAQCVREARFTADDGRIRKLMLRALTETWDRPRELAGACISLIKLDAVVNGFIARVDSSWPARLPATELLDLSIALSRDQLLCRLLESSPITDVGLERLLTNVRLAMLTTSAVDNRCDERLLGFYCTVARQCFINQYVFSMTEVEADQAQRLQASLERALAMGDPCPDLWPAIMGAYFPLHTLSKAEALLDRSWHACVSALLVQQVKEPAEERRIASSIPALTSIESEVSRAVRQQYEESPYPRWVKAGPPGQSIILNDRPPEQGFDALFAGCGTGLSTVEFARQTPRARVLAIDLSIASLCFAQRMAQSYGVTNVEFGQADIAKLGTIGREFDYVEASGVLHHLADPWEGWRTLLALLRPGGVMLVGLYSELARQGIVAARRLIADRGYRPIPEDIRRYREEVMAAEDGSLLKSVIQWNDFFATSECRDLLFHVQEHHITLREIKLFLTGAGVQFGGFMLDALTVQRFVTRFPEPAAMTNLDCWQDFETQAPSTFAAMYQFWVHKPVACSEAAGEKASDRNQL